MTSRAIADTIAAYDEAGVHMISVLLPRPYDPRLLRGSLSGVLEPLR